MRIVEFVLFSKPIFNDETVQGHSSIQVARITPAKEKHSVTLTYIFLQAVRGQSH